MTCSMLSELVKFKIMKSSSTYLTEALLLQIESPQLEAQVVSSSAFCAHGRSQATCCGIVSDSVVAVQGWRGGGGTNGWRWVKWKRGRTKGWETEGRGWNIPKLYSLLTYFEKFSALKYYILISIFVYIHSSYEPICTVSIPMQSAYQACRHWMQLSSAYIRGAYRTKA